MNRNNVFLKLNNKSAIFIVFWVLIFAIFLGQSIGALAAEENEDKYWRSFFPSLESSREKLLAKSGIPGYRPPLCPEPEPERPGKAQKKKKEFSLPKEGFARISIEADEIRHKQGITTAIGNVRVNYHNVQIKAGRIEFDHNSKIIDASQNVIITRGEDKITGNKLKFNIPEKDLILTDAYGEIHDVVSGGTVARDVVYFWGEKIHWRENITIEKGVISSCDRKPPDYHYHLTGEKIVIYPDDRLVIKKSRFFIGKTQLLGLNRLRVPLRPTGIYPYFPQIGSNTLEGQYVKIPIIYSLGKLGSRDHGILNLDWYRKVGIGAGAEHTHYFGDSGAGRISYYNMGSARTSARRYQFQGRGYYEMPGNHLVSINYTAEKFEFPGLISPRIRNFEFFMGKDSGKSRYSILAKNYIYGEYQNRGINFIHKYDLTDNLSTDIAVDLLQAESAKDRKYRLNTLAKLTQKGDIFDAQLIFDHTRSDWNFYVNRLPEIALRSSPFKLGPLDARVSLSAGNFSEMPSGINALRSDLKFSVLNKVFPVGKSGDFAVAAGARQLVYGAGDRKYLLKTRAAFEERLGKNFSLILSHNYQDNNGYSPLAFDFFEKYQVFGSTLSFHTSDRFRFQLTGGYDVNHDIFQTIIPRLEICPSRDFKLLMGSTYDYNNDLWMSIDGELGMKIAKNLNFKYWGIYDLINEKLTYSNYVLEWDTHDFLTRLIYKGSQGEVWLDFTIKILPHQKFEVGPNPDNPVVDREIFDGAPISPSL